MCADVRRRLHFGVLTSRLIVWSDRWAAIKETAALTRLKGQEQPPQLPNARRVDAFEKNAKRALLGMSSIVDNKPVRWTMDYFRAGVRWCVEDCSTVITKKLRKLSRAAAKAAKSQPAQPPAESGQADVVHPPRRQNVAKKLCELTGATYDECLAALEENDDDANDAAAALLTRESLLVETSNGDDGGAAGSSVSKAAPAARTTRQKRRPLRARSCESAAGPREKHSHSVNRKKYG